MKIDLCKLFGVEEGEEFKIKFGVNDKYRFKYRFKTGNLEYYDDFIDKWIVSAICFNTILNSEIIKLPKKKKFSDDELCILRNIDKKYKWIARDESGSLCIFDEKPKKSEEMWDNVTHSDFIELNCYNSLFNSIQWEDEEPIRIDDYVERKESV